MWSVEALDVLKNLSALWEMQQQFLVLKCLKSKRNNVWMVLKVKNDSFRAI